MRILTAPSKYKLISSLTCHAKSKRKTENFNQRKVKIDGEFVCATEGAIAGILYSNSFSTLFRSCFAEKCNQDKITEIREDIERKFV